MNQLHSFRLGRVVQTLSNTPTILGALFRGIDTDMIRCNEREGTWSPLEVVCHLLYLEQTDWIPRIEIILSPLRDKTFEPVNRTGNFEINTKRNIEELLGEFTTIRKANINNLNAKGLTPSDLTRAGIHPQFGPVTLQQLITTWAAHDLTHISQIVRTIALQYKEDVGPWKTYLGVLNNK